MKSLAKIIEIFVEYVVQLGTNKLTTQLVNWIKLILD